MWISLLGEQSNGTCSCCGKTQVGCLLSHDGMFHLSARDGLIGCQPGGASTLEGVRAGPLNVRLKLFHRLWLQQDSGSLRKTPRTIGSWSTSHLWACSFQMKTERGHLEELWMATRWRITQVRLCRGWGHVLRGLLRVRNLPEEVWAWQWVLPGHPSWSRRRRQISGLSSMLLLRRQARRLCSVRGLHCVKREVSCLYQWMSWTWLPMPPSFVQRDIGQWLPTFMRQRTATSSVATSGHLGCRLCWVIARGQALVVKEKCNELRRCQLKLGKLWFATRAPTRITTWQLAEDLMVVSCSGWLALGSFWGRSNWHASTWMRTASSLIQCDS